MHLVRFDVFPYVPPLLQRLRDKHLRLGIISNTGDDGKAVLDAVLSAAGILDFFEPKLRIYSKDVGLKKDSPAIFALSARLAGLAATPQKCLFVGETGVERSFASDAGMRVSSHPLLIEEVAADRRSTRGPGVALRRG